MPMSSWGEKEKEFIPQILAERNASDVRDGTERTSVTSLVELEKVMVDETDKSPKKGNKFVTESNQPSTQFYDGLFCNYFSLGFDATVLYLFHCEREQNPAKFSSPLRNKLVYVEKSPYGVKTPKLKKRIDIFVNNEKGDLVKLKIPKDTRALVSFVLEDFGKILSISRCSSSLSHSLLCCINFTKNTSATAEHPVICRWTPIGNKRSS